MLTLEMKLAYKYFLSFSLILIAFSGLGQIYILQYENYKILVGPENISNDAAIVAPDYLSSLYDLRQGFLDLRERDLKTIEELNIKVKLKKHEKRALRRSSRSKEEIDKELIGLDTVLHLWNELIIFQESLIEASELMNEGQCIEFRTKSGTFYSDELKIEIREFNGIIKYKEAIPVKYVSPETKWVKKKAVKNCVSSNPDECTTWCLVKIQEEYKFTDIIGNEYSYDSCPEGFNYDELKNEWYRKREYNEDYETFEIVTLIRKRGNEVIIPISWETISCD
ncbi:MAG: hypothetical protein GY705_04320 [Bacteroidetes bacterium]|nr:hypothetical protein [Bacteroidota bacterium]